MSVATLVTVTITKTAALPQSDGFGTILLAASHTEVGPRVSTHTSLEAAEDFGFTSTAYPTIHRALTVAFSQSPRPRVVKVGRRDLPPTQSLIVTPLAVQGEGYVWTIPIDGVDVTYTEGPGESVATIIDGLVAAVTAAALGVTATDNVTTLGLDADTAGEVHQFRFDLSVFDVSCDTADPGIATDLSAIAGEDNDWLGLVLDSDSEAEINAAAAWVATRDKILIADVYESGVPDTLTTTDVASDRQAALDDNTTLLWTEGRVSYFYAFGWLARQFAAYDPGRATAHLKPIAGVEAYGPLADSRQLALESKNVNHYAPIALNFHRTINGKLSSGEFIDVTRLIVYIKVRLRELVLNHLQADPKIPQTQAGIASVCGVIELFLRSLQAGSPPALSPDVEVLVPIPDVNSIAAADRANRLLPDIAFSARIAGAIHAVEIRGNLEI